MKGDFLIEIFITITGVGAASGLHFSDDTIHLVGDNSNYLYSYSLSEAQLHKHLLYGMEDANEQVAKKNKLDIESLFHYEDELYLFASASTNARNHLFKVDQSNYLVKHHNLTIEFEHIKKALSIADEDVNIEGSFIFEDKFYLFNRGNGPTEKNGIILIDTAFSTAPEFIPLVLPKYENGVAGFTDAIIHQKKVYFLAAIEETTSTYDDGEKRGTSIGIMDLATLKIEYIREISTTHKFEGITLLNDGNHELVFLLCEDPDDESTETIIYKLTLQK